ncbi:MAG TPA: hypothetical protein DCY89_09355 [Gammaproteobacteria bacterium]|nr:hypothetical protein [Gammaproteobacteria bacterium]
MPRSFASVPGLSTCLALALAAPGSALAASLVAPFQGNQFAILNTGPGALLGEGSTGLDRSGDRTLEADEAALGFSFLSGDSVTSISFALNLLTSEITAGEPDFFLVELTRLEDVISPATERLLSGAVGKENGRLPIIPGSSFDSVGDGWVLFGPGDSLFVDGQTGWHVFSFDIAPGSYWLRFAVFDEGDAIADTALLIDDVRLGEVLLEGFEGFDPGTSLEFVPSVADVVGSATIAGAGDFALVPLPAAAWFFVSGLGLLGAGLRRRAASA